MPYRRLTALAALEQACEDALIEMQTPAAKRLRAAIRIAATNTADKTMQCWASTWLKATEGLIAGSQIKLKAKAQREAAAIGADHTKIPTEDGT